MDQKMEKEPQQHINQKLHKVTMQQNIGYNLILWYVILVKQLHQIKKNM